MLFVSPSSPAAEPCQHHCLGSIRAVAGVHARLCGGFCSPTLLYSRGCGVQPPSAVISAPRVVPNSPSGQLQSVAQLSTIFHTQLQKETAISKPWFLLGNRVWEGSREEMSELGLEVRLGFNHQRREKGYSRQRERQGCLYKEGLYKGCSGTWRGLAQSDRRL